MKPILVAGLGNVTMGGDGAGRRLVEQLAFDGELAQRVECVDGGSDLLRLCDRFPGREGVILIDAVLAAAAPGTVFVFDEPFTGLDATWENAHQPSAVQAVGLLKAAFPSLRAIPFTIIGITVDELRLQEAPPAWPADVVAAVERGVAAIAGRRVNRSGAAARR